MKTQQNKNKSVLKKCAEVIEHMKDYKPNDGVVLDVSESHLGKVGVDIEIKKLRCGKTASIIFDGHEICRVEFIFRNFINRPNDHIYYLQYLP